MPDTMCKATTASGEQCRRKPGPSGYCLQHDPDKNEQRKEAQRQRQAQEQAQYEAGAPLRRVLDTIKQTCMAKGWQYKLDHVDSKTWRHATVIFSRLVPGHTMFDTTKVMSDITVDGNIKINAQSVSGPQVGFDDLMESVRADLSRLSGYKFSAHQPGSKRTEDALGDLTRLLGRFHNIAQQLRTRREGRPTLTIGDEYDVQDLLHALLRGYFDDVRPEETTPSAAGGWSRVDFLLKKEQIVVEAKFVTTRLRDKQIGEQLIIDIERYRVHPNCKTLVCFVYDPDRHLVNPHGLMSDLSGKRDQLSVQVVVSPLG